ncbi:hypothetical protein EDC94DRAFT_647829 [Helicostylum pulchrum]|nr:hypothetical protein EDC94DRAFT_647829 [Helicostylum pulchrum]
MHKLPFRVTIVFKMFMVNRRPRRGRDKLNTIIPALEKFADSDVTDAELINNSVPYLFGNKIFELSMAHVKPEIMSVLNLKGYRLVSPVRYIKQECDPRMPNSKELRQVRFWNLLTNKKSSGVSTAQLILSSIYFENVLLKDIDKSLYRAKKAAKNNHEEGLLLLSLFYSDGRGIEPGYKETKKCFEKAYNSGRAPSASFHLGVLYYNGNGFERNCSTALRLFKEYIMNESNDDHGSAYLFISA